jgi:hypothetical protein
MNTQASIILKRGGLYLSREVYDLYFSGLEAIILLRREDDLLILPVRHAAAGGYLLKRRNGDGDRVVTAPDFFRAQGIDDDYERGATVEWTSESAGLTVKGLFRLQR